MNKTLFSFIMFLLSISLLSSGCQKPNSEHHQPKPMHGADSIKVSESSGWTECYQKDRRIEFGSNHCVIDTLNVTDLFIDERGSLTYPGESTGTVSGYTFVINREYSRMQGSLFIGEENDSLLMRAVLFHRHTGTGDSVKAVPFKPEDYTLYGRTFRDCVVIDSLNSCYSGEAAELIRNKITKYVFSKEYGLIFYCFEDGEEFIKQVLWPLK